MKMSIAITQMMHQKNDRNVQINYEITRKYESILLLYVCFFYASLICVLSVNQQIFTIETESATDETTASSNSLNLLNQIQHILVINKLYVAPIDFLFGILFLFHFKDMLPKYNHNK